MNDIQSIKNYIEFLISTHNLSITLHPIAPNTIISSSELLHFNIHNNSYCLYLKCSEEVQNHCIKKQNKVFEKCKSGSFCGVCHAGVKEYIYPISDGEKMVGFISISGYKSENYKDYLNKISKKYNLPFDELEKSYNTLKDELPQKKFVDTLIIPLCKMLELSMIKNKSEIDFSQSLSQKAVFYIRKNHNRPISTTDICKNLNCSRSYLSSIFKKETGYSIRDYINILRINDAKTMLLYSNFTVTQIAFSVGFTDSNYFTEVFKKYEKMSPLKYKKSH